MLRLLFKLLFKSLVIVLLVAGIGNYLVYLKTGQLPLNNARERMDNWMVDLRHFFSPEHIKTDTKQVMDKIAKQYKEPEPVAPTKVYKWTDADGRVHYGDKPQVANAEQVEVKIQNAISAPTTNQSADNKDAVAAQSNGDSPLEKARAAAEIMRQRIQAQEQLE